MAIDSLWEVTVTAVLRQQQITNVFFYIRNSVTVPNAGSPADILTEEYGGTLIPLLKTRTSNQIDYRTLKVREVVGGFAFAETTFPENNVGAISGDCLPTFVAIQWFSPRTIGNIRAGYKRFAGVPESDTGNGIIITSLIDDWQAIATAFSQNIDIVESSVTVGYLQPVIVKRIKEVDEDDKVSYRLPETLAELAYADANWSAREELTTQNSRKIGRGI
jgi:hypothetical protein